MHRRLATILVPLLALGLTLAACGDDTRSVESGSGNDTTASTTTEQSQETNMADQSDSAATLAEIDERGKPTVTVPDQPATELLITDDIVGDGAEVKPGDQVTVHYVGVGQQSKAEFDSSWGRGEPISFGLNQVIQGWGEGLVGMKVGGRRTLVIPGALAYGPRGYPPDIAPDETLVFTVDLVAMG